MALAIIQAPATMPVSLADAKAHCAVDGSALDGQITRLIAAVTSWLAGPQGWLGRSLCDQTLEWTGEAFIGPVKLPRPPFLSIEAAHYLDGGAATAIEVDDLTAYVRDDGLAHVGLIDGSGWGAIGRGLRIRYRAGYGTSLDPARPVDPGLQHAILVMVARLLEDREALHQSGARDLFGPWIVWGPA